MAEKNTQHLFSLKELAIRNTNKVFLVTSAINFLAALVTIIVTFSKIDIKNEPLPIFVALSCLTAILGTCLYFIYKGFQVVQSSMSREIDLQKKYDEIDAEKSRVIKFTDNLISDYRSLVVDSIDVLVGAYNAQTNGKDQRVYKSVVGEFNSLVDGFLNLSTKVLEDLTESRITVTFKAIQDKESLSVIKSVDQLREVKVTAHRIDRQSYWYNLKRRYQGRKSHTIGENSLLMELLVSIYKNENYGRSEKLMPYIYRENLHEDTGYFNLHRPNWREFYDATLIFALFNDDDRFNWYIRKEPPIGFLCIDQKWENFQKPPKILLGDERVLAFAHTISKLFYALSAYRYEYEYKFETGEA